MKLSPKQAKALESICDTFAPAAEGWPSASEMGVPGALVNAMDFNPRARDRQELLRLLDFWDSRLHGVFAVGKAKRFSSLPLEMRSRVLLDWAGSALVKRRAAFQALRKAVGFMYVMLEGAQPGTSPVWTKLGYPGPVGVQKPHAARALKAAMPDRDMEITCEICVIGSGAGGGTAAGVLAAAGKDVVVLEAGDYYDDADFDGAALDGFRRLYAEAGFAATADHSVGLLAGKCLGGGTVVNYCTSFRTPDGVREEWAGAGVPWFTSEQYTQSLDAVCARLSVNREHNQVSHREQVMERGLRKLGWHVDCMPRNVVKCDAEKVCGYCGYGCAVGAKQSTVKTWLADAEQHGARLLVGTRAERVITGGDTAKGVEARTRAGHRVRVTCKTVIVACGSIHTPALLLRSGLRNPHIGQHLHLHPVSNVCGVFDEDIRPWEGTMQAIYSDEHRQMNGGYGVKYETTSLQPVIAVASTPWVGAAHHRSLLGRLSQTTSIGVLLRDKDAGAVKINSEGHPVATYSLSAFDRKNLRDGFIGAGRILEAAGAILIYSPHAKWCGFEPGKSGSIKSFAEAMDRAGWDNGRLALFSFHIMGTARLGSSPKESATDPDGQTWEVKGLYVMDASSFPSASGVNPMISIEAIAHRNACALAGRVGR
jgi:choline dehydrogenase-like flavoprotein